MRQFLMVVLVLCTSILAFTQQQLTLSSSPFAIKISNPTQQLQMFSQMLPFISGMLSIEVNDHAILTSRQLQESVKNLTQLPGIDTQGDVWITLVKTKQPSESNGNTISANFATKSTNYGRNLKFKFGFHHKTDETAIVLIVPLHDKQAFEKVITEKNLPGISCGKYALLALDGTLPDISEVIFDQHPKTAAPITLIVSKPKDTAGSSPFSDFEIGLTMKNEGLVIDTCICPNSDESTNFNSADVTIDDNNAYIGDSPDNDYPVNSDGTAVVVGEDCARILPGNLAYCKIGGPLKLGATGLLGTMLNKIADAATDMDNAALGEALQLVIQQCQNGRALAVTAPSPNDMEQKSAFIGVYTVTRPNEMRKALATIATQLLPTLDTETEISASKYVTIAYVKDAESISHIPIDTMKIDINVKIDHPTPEELSKPDANKPFKLFATTVYMAFLNNKFIFTAGDRGKEEMAEIITRAKAGKAVLTETPVYKKIRASLPTNIVGFEYIAPAQCVRAFMDFKEKDPSVRKSIIKNLAALPAATSMISSYQYWRDGVEHIVVTVPNELAGVLDTLCNAPADASSPQPAVTQKNN